MTSPKDPKQIMVAHGMVTHPRSEQCDFCDAVMADTPPISSSSPNNKVVGYARISSSRLGDEPKLRDVLIDAMSHNTNGTTHNILQTLINSYDRLFALEAEAPRGITEQSEVAEGNGTAAKPSPLDSEGELDTEILQILETYTVGNSMGLVGPGNGMHYKAFEAAIHRRNAEYAIKVLSQLRKAVDYDTFDQYNPDDWISEIDSAIAVEQHRTKQ